MSETKEKLSPSVSPARSSWPQPEVIWLGCLPNAVIEGEKVPARVVLAYKCVLPKDSINWEFIPEIKFEVADAFSAMNEPRYVARPLTDAPVEFFTAMIDAFRRSKLSI